MFKNILNKTMENFRSLFDVELNLNTGVCAIVTTSDGKENIYTDSFRRNALMTKIRYVDLKSDKITHVRNINGQKVKIDIFTYIDVSKKEDFLKLEKDFRKPHSLKMISQINQKIKKRIESIEIDDINDNIIDKINKMIKTEFNPILAKQINIYVN